MVQKKYVYYKKKGIFTKKIEEKKRNLPKKICLYGRKTLILWSEKLKL